MLSVNFTLTGMRCITLTKFPVALSGGNSEYLDPVVGENDSIEPRNSSSGNASS
ncbi:hypothetical protein D3C87_2137640 [compost metagenome]